MPDSIDSHSAEPRSTPVSPPRAGCLFQLTALAGAAFVLTILAFLAVTLGNSSNPAARWLDRQIGLLIVGEVAALFVFGIMAMSQDRRRTLRELSLAAAKSDAESNSTPDEVRE